MSKREPLSIVVITHNAERDLPRCLSSVAWAAEIVVVDCGSTDDTPAIARRHGARLLERAWSGYVEQKNFGLEAATQSWILSLDADEWLTERGAAELRGVLAAPRADAYVFERRNAFCGAFLDHVWSPDLQLRLFRRGAGRFAGGPVHEAVRLLPGSRVERLGEPLCHLAYRSLEDYVERMNRYTTLAAQGLAQAGRRPSRMRLAVGPPASFLKQFVLRRGFQDGVRGFVAAAGSAYYVLLKYAKLWELERGDAGADPVDPGAASRAQSP